MSLVCVFQQTLSKETAQQRWQPKRYNPTGNDWDSSYDYIAEKLKREWADLFFDVETTPIEEIMERLKIKGGRD